MVVQQSPPVLVDKPSNIDKLREESRKEESKILREEDAGELEFMVAPL